jgi:dGTPase
VSRSSTRNFREAEKRYPAASDKLKFNEALKAMLNAFVGDLIENTRVRIADSGVRTLDELRDFSHRLASFSPKIDAERQQAKDFLYRCLYYSEQLRDQKADGEKIVTELFDHWMHSTASLPPSYRRQIESGTDSHARIVCDYIAGMTDNYILEQHQRLIGGSASGQ